jgi:hypothetical protein
MTSWKWNQVAMHERKWLPAVKFAEFPGILEHLQFNMEGSLSILPPYYRVWGADKTRDDVFKVIARILKQELTGDASAAMVQQVVDNQKTYIAESQERINQILRNTLAREAHRSRVSIGLLRPNLPERRASLLRMNLEMAAEAMSSNARGLVAEREFLKAVNSPNFMRTPDEIKQ